MVCSTKFREKTEQVGRRNIYETRYFRGQSKNKKAAAEAKAMEEAKKGEAEDVLKKLLASGMTAEEILAKLQ